MAKNFFQDFVRRIVSKAVRWILIAVIAFITWMTVISPSTHNRGKELYEQGKQLYQEAKEPVSETSYQVSKDSSATYITVKQENNEQNTDYME